VPFAGFRKSEESWNDGCSSSTARGGIHQQEVRTTRVQMRKDFHEFAMLQEMGASVNSVAISYATNGFAYTGEPDSYGCNKRVR